MSHEPDPVELRRVRRESTFVDPKRHGCSGSWLGATGCLEALGIFLFLDRTLYRRYGTTVVIVVRHRMAIGA